MIRVNTCTRDVSSCHRHHVQTASPAVPGEICVDLLQWWIPKGNISNWPETIPFWPLWDLVGPSHQRKPSLSHSGKTPSHAIYFRVFQDFYYWKIPTQVVSNIYLRPTCATHLNGHQKKTILLFLSYLFICQSFSQHPKTEDHHRIAQLPYITG